MGILYITIMRIIAKKILRDFWNRHADVEQPLRAWHKEAMDAVWNGPADVKRSYPSASILPNNRVVFNIKGNAYRLIVAVRYELHIIYIRFIGTHAEYDSINAETT